MGKFCGKCGSIIDETTGICTKCGQPKKDAKQLQQKQTGENVRHTAGQANYHNVEKANTEKAMMSAAEKEKKKEEEKQAWAVAKQRYKADVAEKKRITKETKKKEKKEKWQQKSFKEKCRSVFQKILIYVLVIGILLGGTYWGLKKYGILDDEKVVGTSDKEETSDNKDTSKDDEQNGSIGIYNLPDDEMPKEYEVEKPNADEYFEENSTVISEMDASKGGRTEAEVYKNLDERGFNSYPITTSYTMDGTYGEEEISDSGTEKHPIYTTIYVTEDGFIWSIFEINGAVFANPVSYNMESTTGIQVMISETEEITSYDSNLNKFYVTKPNETALDVKVVERIDKATLDTLTKGEIDKL